MRRLHRKEESLPYSNPLFTRPDLRQQMRYIAQFIIYKCSYILSHGMLGNRQRWGVAYTHAGWKNLVMWKATRIENPKGRFLADPGSGASP